MTNKNEAVSQKNSPSATILANATEEHVVTDARGRKIVIRKPNIVTATYFSTIFKPECAENKAFMMAMSSLPYVFSIDGVKVGAFTKESDAQALLQELGEEGKDAVDVCVVKNYLSPRMEALDRSFNDSVKK